MEKLIFGFTWEEIQALQQRTYQRKLIPGGMNLPTATQADIEMLRDKGIEYIKGNLLWGVVDRLQNSGILPKD